MREARDSSVGGLGLKGTVRIRCPRAVGYGVQKTSSQKAFKKHSPNTHTRSRQTSAVHALPDPTLPTARPSRPTPRFRTLPLKGTASARRRSTSHFRRRSRRSARCWERRTSGWRRSGWTRTLLRGARTPSGRRPAAQGCAASAAPHCHRRSTAAHAARRRAARGDFPVGQQQYRRQRLLTTYHPFGHAPGEHPAATTCTPGTLQGLAGPGRRCLAFSAIASCIFGRIGPIAKLAGHA